MKKVIFITCYIGHPQGKEEALWIDNYVSDLDTHTYNVSSFKMMNKKNAFPELSNSLEDYIEAVRNIELEKGCATVGEIAEALNVKKPSVSLAMKQLKERGLVEYTQYSPIVLTKSGRHEADRVISCHTMVKEFLMTVLHMEEPRADEVACGIEHIMSLEEISRFQLLTDHVRKCGK